MSSQYITGSNARRLSNAIGLGRQDVLDTVHVGYVNSAVEITAIMPRRQRRVYVQLYRGFSCYTNIDVSKGVAKIAMLNHRRDALRIIRQQWSRQRDFHGPRTDVSGDNGVQQKQKTRLKAKLHRINEMLDLIADQNRPVAPEPMDVDLINTPAYLEARAMDAATTRKTMREVLKILQNGQKEKPGCIGAPEPTEADMRDLEFLWRRNRMDGQIKQASADALLQDIEKRVEAKLKASADATDIRQWCKPLWNDRARNEGMGL